MRYEEDYLKALKMIDDLIDLIHENEYESYLNHHLVSIRIELSRQLTNLQQSSKIVE